MQSLQRRFLTTATGGFSLVEITLAIGIAAFALVAILGMFPVAMKAATESRHETQATFIAQSLFGGLAAGENGQALLITGTNTDGAPTVQTVNLNQANWQSDSLEFDEQGLRVGAPEAGPAVYAAVVNISTNNQPEGLSRVQVTVSAPAGAPNAAEYTFVTLMRNR